MLRRSTVAEGRQGEKPTPTAQARLTPTANSGALCLSGQGYVGNKMIMSCARWVALTCQLAGSMTVSAGLAAWEAVCLAGTSLRRR